MLKQKLLCCWTIAISLLLPKVVSAQAILTNLNFSSNAQSNIVILNSIGKPDISHPTNDGNARIFNFLDSEYRLTQKPSVPSKTIFQDISIEENKKPVSASNTQFIPLPTVNANTSPPKSFAETVTFQNFGIPHIITIVLDPGHGGKDPGAAGPNHIEEKEVVLSIAKKIQQLLRGKNIHVVLTRENDQFLTLRQRLQVARRAHADIFIAIHADAFPDAEAHGASVFALSSRGASSEAARWLAEKENHSELGGVKLNDKAALVRSVLIDLSQTETIHTSIQLGDSLLIQLKAITPLHRAQIEQARFVVLKSPDIASVLVETGFMSNPSDALRLTNDAHQTESAQAIASGVSHYLTTI